MDISAIVADAAQVLAPVLPYLLAKTADVAAGEAIKKVGKDTWGLAQRLWDKLRPAVEAKPSAGEAARDLAAKPDDQDRQAALRVQLEKLLEADQALAHEIARLVDEGRRAGLTVVASGDRSVAAGGDVSGTIITGDGNVAKGPPKRT